jgi:hypothetical protein
MTKKFSAFAVAGLLTLIGQRFELPVRAQAVGFQPVVTPFPSGVTLDVTPSVSADRRYVRMSMGVTFTSLLGFDTYSVPAAVSGSGGMNGAIVGLGGMGMGGGVGAGGGGGFRAAGLGEPRVAGGDQGEGFGGVAGDPFTRASESPADMSAPSASRAPTRDGGAGMSTRPSRAKGGRARGRSSSLARKTEKNRPRAGRMIEGTRDNSTPEVLPEVFPFDP